MAYLIHQFANSRKFRENCRSQSGRDSHSPKDFASEEEGKSVAVSQDDQKHTEQLTRRSASPHPLSKGSPEFPPAALHKYILELHAERNEDSIQSSPFPLGRGTSLQLLHRLGQPPCSTPAPARQGWRNKLYLECSAHILASRADGAEGKSPARWRGKLGSRSLWTRFGLIARPIAPCPFGLDHDHQEAPRLWPEDRGLQPKVCESSRASQ
jgi:hypothetical protein